MENILITCSFIGCIRADQGKTLNQLLSEYFSKEFTYLKIEKVLLVQHQEFISLSTIKRSFNKLSLLRRPAEKIWTDDVTLLTAVREELRVSGSYVRYRRVRAHLRKKEIKVLQEDICCTILQCD